MTGEYLVRKAETASTALILRVWRLVLGRIPSHKNNNPKNPNMRANIYKRHSNARATETPAVVSRGNSDRDEATETHEGHENDDLDFNPCDLNPQGRSRFDVVRLSDNRSLLQDVQCDRARRQQDMTEFRFATWNIGSMTGKDGEMVEILKKRKIQLCCMQQNGKERTRQN